MRDSFVFYRSFYEAISGLSGDSNESKLKLFNSICELALNDEDKTPDLVGMEKPLFILMKPNIESNTRNYNNGKKGGRPKDEKPLDIESKNPPFKINKSNKDKDKDKEEEINKDKDKDKEEEINKDEDFNNDKAKDIYVPKEQSLSLAETKQFCLKHKDIIIPDNIKITKDQIEAIFKDCEKKDIEKILEQLSSKIDDTGKYYKEKLINNIMPLIKKFKENYFKFSNESSFDETDELMEKLKRLELIKVIGTSYYIHDDIAETSYKNKSLDLNSLKDYVYRNKVDIEIFLEEENLK